MSYGKSQLLIPQEPCHAGEQCSTAMGPLSSRMGPIPHFSLSLKQDGISCYCHSYLCYGNICHGDQSFHQCLSHHCRPEAPEYSPKTTSWSVGMDRNEAAYVTVIVVTQMHFVYNCFPDWGWLERRSVRHPHESCPAMEATHFTSQVHFRNLRNSSALCIFNVVSSSWHCCVSPGALG